MIISLPVDAAAYQARASGAFTVVAAVQVSSAHPPAGVAVAVGVGDAVGVAVGVTVGVGVGVGPGMPAQYLPPVFKK
jgi:hypothetical protein